MHAKGRDAEGGIRCGGCLLGAQEIRARLSPLGGELFCFVRYASVWMCVVYNSGSGCCFYFYMHGGVKNEKIHHCGGWRNRHGRP
jgi:hypothetical protein